MHLKYSIKVTMAANSSENATIVPYCTVLCYNSVVVSVMFDVKYGSPPAYLADLCNVRTNERLRSTNRRDFVIPRTRTRTADSAFMAAAPSARNVLPSELRRITSKTIFCNHLKTIFFS